MLDLINQKESLSISLSTSESLSTSLSASDSLSIYQSESISTSLSTSESLSAAAIVKSTHQHRLKKDRLPSTGEKMTNPTGLALGLGIAGLLLAKKKKKEE